MQKTIKPALPSPFILPPETNGRFILLQLLAYTGTFAIASNLGGFLASRIASLSDAGARPLRDLLGFMLGLLMVGVLWALTRQRVASAVRTWITKLDLQTGASVARTPTETRSITDAEHHIYEIAAGIPELTDPPHLVWQRDRTAEIQLNGMAFGSTTSSFVSLNYSLSAALQTPRSRPSFYTIVLHELAHLANQDAAKTIVALETVRSYRVLTGAMASLYFGGALLTGLAHFVVNGFDNALMEGMQLVVMSALQLLCVYLLVLIALRSILRVREYYADARAASWIGLQFDYRISDDNLLPANLFDRVAPTHPLAAQRRSALQQPTILFRVSCELAMLTGALAGIALNSGFQLVTLISSMIDLTREAAPETFLPGLLTLLYPVVFVGVVLFVCLIPMASSLGLQTQRATLADSSQDRLQHSSLQALLLPVYCFPSSSPPVYLPRSHPPQSRCKPFSSRSMVSGSP